MIYRVWHRPCFGTDVEYVVEVKDLQTARLVADVLAGYDLSLTAHKLLGDFANTQGIEESEDGINWLDVEEDVFDEV